MDQKISLENENMVNDILKKYMEVEKELSEKWLYERLKDYSTIGRLGIYM